jgi:hypothetical protein
MRNILRLVVLALLVPSFAVAGQVFKVGPGGTHATVQEAVTAAIAAGGDCEVRVAAGAFVGRVAIDASMKSGSISISGGWDPTFALQAKEPGLTVLDGAGAGSTVHLIPDGGTVTLQNLTITGGRDERGGGVWANLQYGADLNILDCRIVGNTASAESKQVFGGGLHADIYTDGVLHIARTLFANNAATGATKAVMGGGVSLAAWTRGQILMEDCLVTGNSATSSENQGDGAGLFAWVRDDGEITITGTVVARNTSTPGAGAYGSGMVLWANGNARLVASRNACLDNVGSAPTTTRNLQVSAQGASRVAMSETVVAGGNGHGVELSTLGTASLAVSSCTIASNTKIGIYGGATSVFNTIAFANGSNCTLSSNVETGGNLIGVDPLFVNAALRDYRLLPGSPAFDAGVASPPGGLSETDFTGQARVVGAKVDVGAHEYQGSTHLSAAALAHTLGYLDTPWRSDLDLANLGSRQADLTLRYRSASGDQTKPVTLTPGEARGWSDVLVDLFGVGAGDKTSGALEAEDPTGAVVAAVRTYADGGAVGTYGQGYPALPGGAGIATGTVGILPLVKSNTGFYSNVGILNLGDVAAQARVTLVGSRGPLGSPVTLSADPGRWTQLSDVFAKAGVASASVAYATVEPLTTGARLWGAASIVDRITRDPTTVEASVPVAAGAVQRVASVAHSSGSGGTAWRSTVAVANPGSAAANVTLTYRGSNTLVRTIKVGAHGVSEWPDVLVDLFNMRPDSSESGSLEVVADQPLAVGCRTFADKGQDGTYGQSYPALTADRGIMPGETGVLAQLRKSSTAYTNIGALNLSTGPCTASVQLHDAQGQAIGAPLKMTPAGGAWTQVTDAFRVAGAGGANAACARVTVETEGCSMWFYASVIDSLTRDPTTVELARPFVVGPGR